MRNLNLGTISLPTPGEALKNTENATWLRRLLVDVFGRHTSLREFSRGKRFRMTQFMGNVYATEITMQPTGDMDVPGAG